MVGRGHDMAVGMFISALQYASDQHRRGGNHHPIIASPFQPWRCDEQRAALKSTAAPVLLWLIDVYKPLVNDSYLGYYWWLTDGNTWLYTIGTWVITTKYTWRSLFDVFSCGLIKHFPGEINDLLDHFFKRPVWVRILLFFHNWQLLIVKLLTPPQWWRMNVLTTIQHIATIGHCRAGSIDPTLLVGWVWSVRSLECHDLRFDCPSLHRWAPTLGMFLAAFCSNRLGDSSQIFKSHLTSSRDHRDSSPF